MKWVIWGSLGVVSGGVLGRAQRADGGEQSCGSPVPVRTLRARAAPLGEPSVTRRRRCSGLRLDALPREGKLGLHCRQGIPGPVVLSPPGRGLLRRPPLRGPGSFPSAFSPSGKRMGWQMIPAVLYGVPCLSSACDTLHCAQLLLSCLVSGHYPFSVVYLPLPQNKLRPLKTLPDRLSVQLHHSLSFHSQRDTQRERTGTGTAVRGVVAGTRSGSRENPREATHAHRNPFCDSLLRSPEASPP